MRGLPSVFAAALALAAALAQAQPAPADPAAAAGVVTPTAVVEAFHQALRENYQQGVIDQLAPDVIIYEQGYVERSRDAYAGSHLHDDMLFASATERTVVRREAWEDEDTAWVITQSITEGNFAGRELGLDNTETMVLKRSGNGWKISHIHWSAHPRPPRAAPSPAPTAPAPSPAAAPPTAPAPAAPPATATAAPAAESPRP